MMRSVRASDTRSVGEAESRSADATDLRIVPSRPGDSDENPVGVRDLAWHEERPFATIQAVHQPRGDESVCLILPDQIGLTVSIEICNASILQFVSLTCPRLKSVPEPWRL